MMIKLLGRFAVKPGPCACECAGCDIGYAHCRKSSRGCGWTL